MEQAQNDPTLRDLIQQAIALHKENNADSVQLALEKIWDVFERIKTIYNNDKKTSLKELKNKISYGYEDFVTIFENEFRFLTDLGNKYQIRHFERDKKIIPSNNLKIYFFKRCATLIDLCNKYINNDVSTNTKI